MERLKKSVEEYHREQLHQFDKTFHYKAQQEHFIHEIFSSDLSLLKYQEASQAFLTARGETLVLLLHHNAFSQNRSLQYVLPMPDRSLPFYMAYLDDRNAQNIVQGDIPENMTRVTLSVEHLEGLLMHSALPQVILEKNFARGTVVLGNESTTVRLPYRGYRTLDDRRVAQDAKQFLAMIRGLYGQEPVTTPFRS